MADYPWNQKRRENYRQHFFGLKSTIGLIDFLELKFLLLITKCGLNKVINLCESDTFIVLYTTFVCVTALLLQVFKLLQGIIKET